MDVREKKKELRGQIKLIKNSLSPDEKKSMSLAVQNLLLQSDIAPKAKTILLYHALPDEVDTSLLLEVMSSRHKGDKKIILPVVSGDILLLKEYVPQNLMPGYNKIMEPVSDECIDPSEIDLAIIPGVAFDRKCNRMGRGKGFYDKLLPHLNCLTVGLAFPFQIVENIPCESFDKPLDMVFTDTEVYCLR